MNNYSAGTFEVVTTFLNCLWLCLIASAFHPPLPLLVAGLVTLLPLLVPPRALVSVIWSQAPPLSLTLLIAGITALPGVAVSDTAMFPSGSGLGSHALVFLSEKWR